LIFLVDGQKYTLQDFTNNEETFESFIEQNAAGIFGKDSIYLSKTKIKSSSGIGVIPDAFLITFEPQVQWYVVEVELAAHQLFAHVHNQVTRFLNAVKDPSAQQHLLDFFDDQLQLEHQDKLALIKQRNGEVFKFLWNLLRKPPTILIIIDEKEKQLDDVVNSLSPNRVIALEFNVFSKLDEPTRFAFLFEPLFPPPREVQPLKRKPPTIEMRPKPAATDCQEVNYWITSVKDHDAETAEEAISKLVGQYGIYGFGDSTGGRRTIRTGDMICFYRNRSGIVAHAKIASAPKRQPDSRIQNADRYPWTFDLNDRKVYLENPIILDESLRNRLDAFQGKDAKNNWAWFVQSTHRVTQHDFGLLTGNK
jgi:hypothetical protein